MLFSRAFRGLAAAALVLGSMAASASAEVFLRVGPLAFGVRHRPHAYHYGPYLYGGGYGPPPAFIHSTGYYGNGWVVPDYDYRLEHYAPYGPVSPVPPYGYYGAPVPVYGPYGTPVPAYGFYGPY